MAQYPYLQRKNLYPKTQANEPIVYYPRTVKLASHKGRCTGCGKEPTRVDSYYHFELCNNCNADEVGYHIFNNE